MQQRKNILYIVEGETEQKLLETLKTELSCIIAGKIMKHNVVQDILKKHKFISLKKKTLFILIFDTDADGIQTLKDNITILSKLPNSGGVLTIPQVLNLEDELCYSCGIKDIRVLTKSKSFSDVKRDLINITNLGSRLNEVGFSITRLWERLPVGDFSKIENHSSKIKLT